MKILAVILIVRSNNLGNLRGETITLNNEFLKKHFCFGIEKKNNEVFISVDNKSVKMFKIAIDKYREKRELKENII